ncbi:unnamed protein product [Discosporangium mesarthrocarpum]
MERFADTYQAVKVQKTVEILKGKGDKLSDIPNVAELLSKTPRTVPILGSLHSLLFNRPGKKAEIKRNLLGFSGAIFANESERARMKDKLEGKKWTLPMLKEGMDLLEVPRSAASFKGAKNPDKSMLVERFVEWLECPRPSGKKVKGHTHRREASKSLAAKKQGYALKPEPTKVGRGR